jgi:WD40 repeat protein
MKPIFALIACLAVPVWASQAVKKPAAKPPSPVAAQSASGTTYENTIKPMFAEYCVGCHSKANVKNLQISGGLALDSYDAALQSITVNGKKHIAVVPGKAMEGSLLPRLVSKEVAQRMPKGGDPLSAPQIAKVEAWLTAGAPKGSATKVVRVASTTPVTPTRTLDIRLATKLAPPEGVAPADTPKDTKLELLLGAGPLAPVTAVAYSNDGKLLATGLYQSVVFWDVATGKPTSSITGLAGQVHSIVWSADGTRLAVAGGAPSVSGEIKIYDATKNFAPVGSLEGHTDVVYSVSFSADGKLLASGSHDKTVRTWTLTDMKPGLTLKNHSDAVYQVRFMPDGKSIVSVGADRAVRRVEADSGKSVRNYEGHGSGVMALAIKPDGSYLVTAGLEARLRWWNAGNGNIDRYSDGYNLQVNDIVFSKDGGLLAAVGADRLVRIWDGNNGGQMKTLDEAPDWNYALAFTPDKKFLAVGGADGVTRIWSIEKGLYLGTLAAVAGKTGTEWMVGTPSGYFAASDGWAKRVRVGLAGKPLKQGTGWLPVLNQPDATLKTLQGTPPADQPKLAAATTPPATAK